MFFGLVHQLNHAHPIPCRRFSHSCVVIRFPGTLRLQAAATFCVTTTEQIPELQFVFRICTDICRYLAILRAAAHLDNSQVIDIFPVKVNISGMLPSLCCKNTMVWVSSIPYDWIVSCSPTTTLVRHPHYLGNQLRFRRN